MPLAQHLPGGSWTLLLIRTSDGPNIPDRTGIQTRFDEKECIEKCTLFRSLRFRATSSPTRRAACGSRPRAYRAPARTLHALRSRGLAHGSISDVPGKFRHPVNTVSRFTGRGQTIKIMVIGIVHRHDAIELLEIPQPHLPGPVRQQIPPGIGRIPHAGIGLFAGVSGIGSGGIRLQLLPQPPFSTICRKMPSAAGERQIFPRQTNSILYLSLIINKL